MPIDDVVIAGAGPAGALAALILAKAGLRVRVFDRARFPRHKLCGDTLNPGAMAVLGRHVDVAPLIEQSDPIHGMCLTGPGGVRVCGEYGGGVTGRAITRVVLDRWLIDRAIAAGAQFEDEVAVRDVTIDEGRATGVVASHRGNQSGAHPARMVIAADGRRSAIAIGRGLSRQPQRPRRWAIGGYFTDATGRTTLGEMHVRRGHYIGVAPIPGGLTNACLEVPGDRGLPLSKPADALDQAIKADPELRERFANARPVAPPVMLGPLAVDATAAGEPGLLLAGDAAGFIDPMTGDGMRLAMRGGELAAAIVQEVLGGTLSIDRAHLELASRRREEFQAKWRFNRALRTLVSSPSSIIGASITAKVLPSVFERVIRFAGDCPEKPGHDKRQ